MLLPAKLLQCLISQLEIPAIVVHVFSTLSCAKQKYPICPQLSFWAFALPSDLLCNNFLMVIIPLFQQLVVHVKSFGTILYSILHPSSSGNLSTSPLKSIQHPTLFATSTAWSISSLFSQTIAIASLLATASPLNSIVLSLNNQRDLLNTLKPLLNSIRTPQ
jgi:hypothetical protein